MSHLNMLVICENDILGQKLTRFIDSLGHHTEIITQGNLGLDYIEKNRPQVVIVSSSLTDLNAQEFIVKASQRKVFSSTTFILANEQELNPDDKIRFMTLGFSNFIKTLFDQNDQTTLAQLMSDEVKLIAA